MAERREPWISIDADTVFDSRWKGDALLFFVFARFLAHARVKRACKPDIWPAAKFEVDEDTLKHLTTRSRRDIAEKTAQSLSKVVSSSVERRGEVWEITIHNYAKYQHFSMQACIKAHPDLAPSSGSQGYLSARKQGKKKEEHPSGGAPPPWEPWLRILSKKPEPESEKRAFFEESWDLIDAEARVKANGGDAKAVNAATRAMIFRFWKNRDQPRLGWEDRNNRELDRVLERALAQENAK